MEISRDIGYPSPTSSPPSPLPISIGPGNQKYIFYPSPSHSPPFSPPGSSCTSTDNLPLLLEERYSGTPRKMPLAFSLDRKEADDKQDSEGSSCLQDLLEWFFGRCCHCCSTLLRVTFHGKIRYKEEDDYGQNGDPPVFSYDFMELCFHFDECNVVSN